MKLFLVLSVLISTATALHCFQGTLLVGSYNKLPPKDCGNIDHCINGTIENEDGGLFMAACTQLNITSYGSDTFKIVDCAQVGAMNSCNSFDFPGPDNTTSTRGTLCCCNDDWCNKSAFGMHSFALPLALLSITHYIL